MDAESRIRELIEANLVDNHHPEIVDLVDQLLLIAPKAGTIKAWFCKESALCFQVGSRPVWKVELGRAKSKLRALYARLGVVCMERTGQDVNLYGDEVSLEVSISRQSQNQTVCLIKELNIRFKNTMHEQGFVIETV